MRIKALAAFGILSWATASFAQPAPSPFKFEMHGFTAGTIFMQDGGTQSGSGQTAIYAANPQPNADKLMFGGDARESRFNWSVTGPQVMGGATPKAVLEIDWFGNFGSGNFGEVHLVPRLRTAYAELNWGTTRIVFGQNYDLTAALGAVTLAHIAQPLTLAAGNAGFRRAGVWGYHTFGDVKNPKGWKYEFAWELGRSAWTDQGSSTWRPQGTPGTGGTVAYTTVGNGMGSAACAGLNGNAIPAGTGGAAIGQPVTTQNATGNTSAYGNVNVCTGEASALPAVQARISVTKGADFSMFVGGHWNRVDRSGMGVVDPSTGPVPGTGQWLTPLDVVALVAGAKYVIGPVTLAASGYIGKNDAPLIAAISGGQFTAAGDVHEFGVWGQIGYNFTKELSLWGFMGIEKMNDNDIERLGANATGYAINRNITGHVLAQYRDGGYAIGLEWAHFRTNYIAEQTYTAQGVSSGGLQTANQLALTGVYYF